MTEAARQRVVFFGAGAFGLPTLGALAEACDLVAVVTQPDRRAGRGRAPAPTPIGAWADAHLDLERVLRAESVNKPAVCDRIRELPADVWVIIAFGQKLGQALLADRFAINLHASLLPRWRGAAPINAAILAGDIETGNSVITLADRMDGGLILGQSRRSIDPQQTAGELHDLLAADGPDLVLRVLAERAAGRLAPRTQDESKVTIAPKLSKADGWVDFAEPASAVRRRIHGLTPWPGVTVQFRAAPLKLLRANIEPPAPKKLAPGALLDPALGTIACGAGAIRLLEVQPAGGKPMAWSEFARGRSPQAGEQLIGHAPAEPTS
ncbi:MAG: methionyl-tRNA formyltransferase [Phycisphaerales bacterium JB039]